MKIMKRPLISHFKRTTKVSPQSSNTSPCYDLCNAITSEICNQVQPVSSVEIKQSIQDAYQAQQLWYKDYTPTQRNQILLKASQILSCNQQILSQIEVNETFRPINEIQSYDVPTAIQTLSYYSQLPSILPSGNIFHNLDNFAYTIHEPLGLTIGIGPWNYPLVNVVAKSAPALIFGNAMIYKPSESTPSSALYLAQVYEDAGLPEGVFQVLLGKGYDVGKSLIDEYCSSLSSSTGSTKNNTNNTHGKISFTGSVATGHDILKTTAKYNSKQFYKLTLELGGKSPLIIMKDCIIDDAVRNAINANFYSNGQVCSNGTRVYVHESIENEFVSKLIDETAKLKIGDPNDVNVDIGPMISREHMEKVLNYIQVGKYEDKATLVYGGERLSIKNNGGNRIDNENGYFLSPAIFTNCKDDMRIVQEEVFGMLMSVLSFTEEEEVIERANASDFGLAAGIVTNDLKQAHRMASQLKAASVWVNNYNRSNMAVPWGAFKRSGIGCDNGLAALEAWTTQKVIYVDFGR